jgi:hypothetical protein
MRLHRKAESDPKDHFLGIRKMVDLGSGAKREIEDITLTRKESVPRKICRNGNKARISTA